MNRLVSVRHRSRRFRLAIAVSVLLALVAVSCGSGAKSSAGEPAIPFAGELQQALDHVLDADGARGFSLTVMVPGYEPWEGVVGESEPGIPITADMAFGAGSISKSFVAALVLQLAEEGRLSLDDRLHEWLPPYPNINVAITIRQLLGHTSGIFSLEDHPAFWQTVFADGTRVWTDDELLATFQAERLALAGTGWHYSNTGYLLLGQIIEQATGSTVSAELRERFFEPLGLTSAFYLSEETAPGDVAEDWFDIGLHAPAVDTSPGSERFSQFPWAGTVPEAGGVFASTIDLATWAQALYHDQTVLNSESLDQMLDFYPIGPDHPRGWIIEGYGLGASKYNRDLFEGALMIGHSGGVKFYSASSLYMPDYGATIGAAQNFYNEESIGLLLAQVARAITTNVEPMQ